MRYFVLAVIATFLSITAYADGTKTCKVLETDGSVEVSVTVVDEQTGKCVISFSNDTSRNVNVRYVVYDSASRKQLPGSSLVYANSETVKEITFGIPVNMRNVSVTSLTGEKCKK